MDECAMSTLTLELPLDRIADVCRAHRVRELSLFGSALRDDFREESDLDFLVVFEDPQNAGIFEYADLELALTILLHRKIDIVPKSGLKTAIRDEVLSSATVVYASRQSSTSRH